MKHKIYLLLFLVVIGNNLYADISCSKPKLTKPSVVANDLYHFKATVICNITNAAINLNTLKDAYRDEITAKKSQFKVHDQHAYSDNNGLSGYWLDVTQSFTTDYGPLTVRGQMLLLDNNTNKFYQELKSTSVHGEGDTKYNKSILNQTSLEVFPDHTRLIINKEIDVEEPWFAPHGTFVDSVEEDLIAEINKSAQKHARKVIGENVNALRK